MSFVNFVSDMPSVTVRGDILYQGTVVDNNDPLKLGRVRVRVSQFMPDGIINSSHCPWAVMRRTGWGGSAELSSFAIPNVNSKVLVQFNGGDIYSPVYETNPVDSSSKLTDMDTHYPSRFGWKDPDGSSLVTDLVDHTLDYVHRSGFEFHIRQDGNVDILMPQDKVESITRDETKNIGGSLTESVEKDVTQTVTGNISIDATGNITIDGTNTNLYGTAVKLGSSSAVDYVALFTALSYLATTFNAHIHSGITSGPSNSGAPTTALTFIPGTHYTTITKAL